MRIGLRYTRDEKVWGLGDAAMSRICWSQDSSTSMEYDGCIVDGPWAGHRFAIVTVSVFDEMTRGREGWVGVTDEVNNELASIWRAEGLLDEDLD